MITLGFLILYTLIFFFKKPNPNLYLGWGNKVNGPKYLGPN